MRTSLIFFMGVSLALSACAVGSEGPSGVVPPNGEGGSAGGGGEGGSGGDPGEHEETSNWPGVSRIAIREEPPTQMTCRGGSVYWIEAKSRSICKLDGAAVRAVATVDGEGDIDLRAADSGLLVSSLGQTGSVKLLEDQGELVSVAETGAVLGVAAGYGQVLWYDGRSILQAGDPVVTPEAGVDAFDAYNEGPVWIASNGDIYKLVRGVQLLFGRAGSDYRARTFMTFGATVAWGSKTGVRMVAMDGLSASFGNDVAAMSKGASGLSYCDNNGQTVRIRVMHPEAYSQKDEIAAEHPSCVSVVECGGKVYWSTERGSVFSAPVPSFEDD